MDQYKGERIFYVGIAVSLRIRVHESQVGPETFASCSQRVQDAPEARTP